MAKIEVVIKHADMSEDMINIAIDSATQALQKHCIVGRNFGSYVTHETNYFVYFYLGQVAILLFKSG
ncbi:hypothetical protein PRIPAC_95661 [Pristionchus pacificus]|uniref:Dynein light chain n=1 Tax=Pristionchus pacificus TaxID=54126 RepID=A0A2A6BJE4_PRIPA|nr:hypothetical protein PRIPAC_95661 [Pristionchus pacificus]|eukprot:PDM66022.1 hypothetical protein PRIPAC_44116 [Pristionchus pacificus]